MENGIDEMLKRAEEIAQRHERIHAEITREVLGNPDVPEDFKERVRRNEANRGAESAAHAFRMKMNEGRTILGYDPESFMPVYEGDFSQIP